MTNSKFANGLTAIVCTVLFSATCVLSAVGPAQAAKVSGATQAPVVAPLA